MQPFTLLIKPTGSDCNLNCTYCFYKGCGPTGDRRRMSDAVLTRLVQDYLRLRLPLSVFCWQGGEPTLMGPDFYRRVVDLQRQYGEPGQRVSNSIQTNGVLLDEAWCRFLHENKFLVGVSIDGPKELHDLYRRDMGGNGSFDRVVRAIQCCKGHGVLFNTLTLINDQTCQRPEEIFDFLVDLGSTFMQFIPCVETDRQTGRIADYSVPATAYGEFLCRLFDRWMAFGPAKISIRPFDSLLSHCMEGRQTICMFDRRCGEYLVVEHNGDVFPCDFFVGPQWHLGSLTETSIGELAAGPGKRQFVRAKEDVSTRCLVCRHLAVCRGGCVRHRTVASSGQATNQDYFCEGHKIFFDHAKPRLMQLAAQLKCP
jgi:uncharacterized protein